MEENVALDSKQQKKFDKSIKGIKKLLKKNKAKPHKPAVLAPKPEEDKKEKKKKTRPERGLVYLSHIPHGFYEHEMTQYFKQFGMVTKVRVIRSPRTGRSKGFAFVEFREPAVAEIVAETMNNYLMGKRLIKAAIIPPEKQKHKAFRKYWNSKNNPTANRRIKERKAYNAIKTDDEHLKKAKKMLHNLQKTKKKLNDMGINYDFFKPVDVPQALLENFEVKSESESKALKIEKEEKQKKKNKTNALNNDKVTKEKPQIKSKSAETKSKKEVNKPQESDKARQSEKQKKMQDAGVKLPENFIKVAEESAEESDSSLDFDSDEYETMLANDSDASSGDQSEDDDDDDDEEECDDEESEEELPSAVQIKQKKSKKPLVALPPSKKASKPANVPKAQKPQAPQPKKGPKPAEIPQNKKTAPVQQGVKRKIIQPEVTPKKPKFEKKDMKPRNKQFKKKNKA